ncbi:hypothetical protein C8Q78DRAFT_1039911 [Trametes maxima]|nr:hypothetical protein C8Q78DRAFT_1039911 [Trametes maxima]
MDISTPQRGGWRSSGVLKAFSISRNTHTNIFRPPRPHKHTSDMSASQDRPTTHALLENRVGDSTSDRPSTNFQPMPPSETVEPTQVTTPTQQAATQPGAGGVQHIVVEPTKPSFTQQVVGYAKEIRGTILHKPETKDYGGKIRKGEEPWPPSPEKDIGGLPEGAAPPE